MAEAKKRGSKKTPAQKRVAKAQENKRRQNLRGAAKRSAADAALKRARNPRGIRATIAARERNRERNLGVQGTAIGPDVLRSLEAEARQRGFRSASEALRAPSKRNPAGAVLRQKRLSIGGTATNAYGKRGSSES